MNDITFNAFCDEFEKIAGKAGAVGKFVRGVGRNLKGAVKDLSTPVKSTKRELRRMKRDVSSAISGKGPGGKKLTVGKRLSKGLPHALSTGLTGAAAYQTAKEDSGDESKLRKATRFAGATLGGLATGSRGLSGGLLGSMAGERAGALVGSAVDKARGHKKRAAE